MEKFRIIRKENQKCNQVPNFKPNKWLFVILVCFLGLNLSAQTLLINLSVKKGSLHEILKEIKKQSGKNIVYNNNLIDKYNDETVDLKDAKLEDVLKKVLEGKELNYKIVDDVIIIEPKAEKSRIEKSITINGIVKAADTGEPVPFAYVKDMNSAKVQACSEAGLFRLTSMLFPLKLQISSIGYSPTQVIINQSDTLIIVTLKPVSIKLNEINVYTSRSGIQASNVETIKSTESYNLAGTSKDIFRSVQTLAGVSTNNAASARYNVRGGSYDENLMLVNGIEMTEPYHIKIFPQMSIGIFNIDLVQRIDFSAGGFSAEYGDALSSVMNVEYKKANNDSLTGRINLGMVDLGLVTEIPLSKKTSILFGARHSYLDPIIRMTIPNQMISLRYYDIQVKFDYNINPRNKLSVLAIYSEDIDKIGPRIDEGVYKGSGYLNNAPITYTQIQKGHVLVDANYYDLMFALKSQHILSRRFIINSDFSYYHENENTPQTRYDTTVYNYSIPSLFNRMYSSYSDVRNYIITNFEYKLSAKIMFNQSNILKIGMYVRHSEFDYKRVLTSTWNYYNNTQQYPDTTELFLQPDDAEYNSTQLFKANAIKFGGFATHMFQITSKFLVNIGVRTDYFDLNKELDISPRANLSYSLKPNLKITAAWGIFYKSPLMKQTMYSYSTSENTKSQKATHYLVGIEKSSDNKSLKVEAYYKRYDDLIPMERALTSEIIYKVKTNTAEGNAKGIDFIYSVSNKKLEFSFNYSLSSAKERLKGTSDYYSRYTDQRHTVSSLLLFKMLRKKEFGIKITYGSGYAYQAKYYDRTIGQWVNGDKIRTANLPYYLSVDLRFNKEFNVYSHPLQLYIDVMNLFGRKNVIGHSYHINGYGPYEIDESMFGIIPTFGIMYSF
ncbi:MAG: hypothetical protein EHM93_11560 [Bacteroidales bacterium]|nr:MAG: hypothetical protein EHM93_11560 [Bacteroidales bacterium]